ncbi:alkaline phosphatase D family protein [Propionibacteriaceae bacterium Y2011]
MINRRRLFTTTAAGAAGVGALATAGQPARPAAARERLTAEPFTLGVASGDATPTAVVLWTRLAPLPLQPEADFGMAGFGAVDVEYRVAESEAALADPASCLRVGTTPAKRNTGFSVHLDVTELAPDSEYWYQFGVDGFRSRVGRTRTAPAPGTRRDFTFALVNCQSLAGGNLSGGRPNPMYFNGYGHLARRDDIDFVVHLGDYIYEFGRAAHVPPRPVQTLDEYRTRYAQYKLRSSLADVHARFGWYAIPDDHEFWNDFRGGALPQRNVERFNHAAEAYWEHMPFRNPRPGDLEATTPNQIDLHRTIRWGSLLDLFLGDTRQYRSATTMLGTAQQAQLIDWIGDSDATWTAIGVGQPVTGFGGASGWVAADHAELTAALAARKQRAPEAFNPVILSGDAHCGIVTHTRLHGDKQSPFVATEFVNAPMSSGGRGQWRPAMDPRALRKAYNKGAAGGWQNYNGYTSHSLSADGWLTDYVLGDQVSRPDGAVTSAGRWLLPAGHPVGSVQARG